MEREGGEEGRKGSLSYVWTSPVQTTLLAYITRWCVCVPCKGLYTSAERKNRIRYSDAKQNRQCNNIRVFFRETKRCYKEMPSLFLLPSPRRSEERAPTSLPPPPGVIEWNPAIPFFIRHPQRRTISRFGVALCHHPTRKDCAEKKIDPAIVRRRKRRALALDQPSIFRPPKWPFANILLFSPPPPH